MKIRNGFVGNSSSASFTLIVDETFEKLAHLLKRDCFGDFFLFEKDLKQEVKDAVEENMESLKESPFYNFESINLSIKDYEKILQEIDGYSEKDLFKQLIYLKYRIDIIEADYDTAFKWFTTMLNDYASSVPDLIKEIILLEKADKCFKTKLIVDRN